MLETLAFLSVSKASDPSCISRQIVLASFFSAVQLVLNLDLGVVVKGSLATDSYFCGARPGLQEQDRQMSGGGQFYSVSSQVKF